jgi:hypothetical protein
MRSRRRSSSSSRCGDGGLASSCRTSSRSCITRSSCGSAIGGRSYPTINRTLLPPASFRERWAGEQPEPAAQGRTWPDRSIAVPPGGSPLLQRARGRIPGDPCDATSNPATLVVFLGFPAPLVTNNVATLERLCSSEVGRPPPGTAPFRQMAASDATSVLDSARSNIRPASAWMNGAKLLSPVLSGVAASFTSGPRGRNTRLSRGGR